MNYSKPISILHNEDKVYVALSGGKDSMSALAYAIGAHLIDEQFYRKTNRQVIALHFNHGSESCDLEEQFVRRVAFVLGTPLVVGRLSRGFDGGSIQKFWREERYAFLQKFNDAPIILGHHLDDAVETFLWAMMNGVRKTIPFRRDNCIRPFLIVEREELHKYGERLQKILGKWWVEDPTNCECDFKRNQIRHRLVPVIEEIQPGLRKIVRKMIVESL